MLKANLKHSAGGKGEYERVFHDLFYPRSQTSRDIACGPTEDPGRNLENLWLIDERLVFHTLLASDQPLSQSGVILDDPDLTKNDEPDLIIFNPAFVAMEAGGVESVAVVEFKRPGRNDYTAKSNPIAQIIEIVRKLRDGAIVGKGGEVIAVSNALRVYGYAVCDVTPTLKPLLEYTHLMKETPDGIGWYVYHERLNLLIELIPYSKLVNDAERRNMAFFRKLNIM